MDGTDLVVGAFGSVGSAICSLLTLRGRAVRTLEPDHEPEELEAALEGVETLYSAHWPAQSGDAATPAQTVRRCGRLIGAAEAAGVHRIVQVSAAHASPRSPWAHLRGWARVEERLVDSPLPTLAVRLTMVFGGGDGDFIDDLAGRLRHSSMLTVAGGGHYRIRPVHVDDVARLCVGGPRLVDQPEVFEEHTVERVGHVIVDAVGPDRPTWSEVIHELRPLVHSHAVVVPMPSPVLGSRGPILGMAPGEGRAGHDELVATIRGMADTEGPPTGDVSLWTWIHQRATLLGADHHHQPAA